MESPKACVCFLSLSGMVGPLWDLCECQVEFGNVLQRSVKQICHFVLCIKNIYKLE